VPAVLIELPGASQATRHYTERHGHGSQSCHDLPTYRRRFGLQPGHQPAVRL